MPDEIKKIEEDIEKAKKEKEEAIKSTRIRKKRLNLEIKNIN